MAAVLALYIRFASWGKIKVAEGWKRNTFCGLSEPFNIQHVERHYRTGLMQDFIEWAKVHDHAEAARGQFNALLLVEAECSA